ncbi:transducin (beta)-like 1, partial [Tremellales sp. Uapishka_1]
MSASKDPKVTDKDFDPSEAVPEDEEQEDEGGGVEMSSVEINILIYLYLLESNFAHTAFSMLAESNLAQTSLFKHFHPAFPSPYQPTRNPSTRTNGTPGRVDSPVVEKFGRPEERIPRGELIRKLWKGLRWEEVERHLNSNGELIKPLCPNKFHLLVPHVCPSSYASSSKNPALPLPSTMRLSPAPRRADAFPPPLEAGPSNPRKQAPESEKAKGKRKIRDKSPVSTSSKDSPFPPGISPKLKGKEKEKGEKKRARISEPKKEKENGMDIDSEKEKEKERPNAVKRVSMNGTAHASKKTSTTTDGLVSAPPTMKTTKKKSAIWIPESDMGIWTRHKENVTCVSWNPKNTDVLASAGGDAIARLWDFENVPDKNGLNLVKMPTFMEHRPMERGRKSITSMAWHPDGTVLCTVSQDGVGRLFTPSGQFQGIMSYHRGPINSVKFSPSGSSILTAGDDFTVCLWALGPEMKQRMRACFDAHTSGWILLVLGIQAQSQSAEEVNDVDWLDDEVFASGGNDKSVFVHRVNDKRPKFVFKGHQDDVQCVRFSPLPSAGSPPESRLLASVSDDGYCIVWGLPQYPDDRATSSRSRSPVKAPEEEYDGTTPKNSWLQRLQVVSSSENTRMNTLEWSPGSTQGRMILAAGGQDSTIKIFEVISGQCLHALSGLEQGVGSLAFCPAGFGGELGLGLIAGGGWNGKLVIWDVHSGTKLKEFEVDEDSDRQNSRSMPMMYAMAWRNDGQHLAVGLQDKSVMTVWVGDLGSKKEGGVGA